MKRSRFTADLPAEMQEHASAETLEFFNKLLSDHASERETVIQNISTGDQLKANTFDLHLLDHSRIFHISQIKRICIDYRLRFLDSSLFKGEIPSEAINKIQQLQRDHQTTISGFRIIAPSRVFALKNINDPLLMAPVSNGYYYLVHQWGNDLSKWRKWKYWPVRNFGNFLFCVLLLSVLFTMIMPSGALDRKIPMARIIVFLFAFKSFFAVLLYSFFILGKRFSNSSWDSPYFNN